MAIWRINGIVLAQKEHIRTLFQKADGLLVVAANGFSIAEGFAILRNSPWFETEFSDYIKKYGFQAPIQAMTYPYPHSAEYQEFYQRLMKQIHYDKPESAVMKDLKKLTAGHPCFVLTTNGEDRFVQAGYPENDVFYMEGRFNHRRDHSYIDRQDLKEIESADLLETAIYPGSAQFKKKVQDLNEFLNRHHRILILELGVSATNGWLRPVIQQIMMQNTESYLIEMNQKPNPVSGSYSDRVIQIPGELESSLKALDQIIKQSQNKMG